MTALRLSDFGEVKGTTTTIRPSLPKAGREKGGEAGGEEGGVWSGAGFGPTEPEEWTEVG